MSEANLISEIKLAAYLGVGKRAVQVARERGRITPAETRKAGNKNRFFYNPEVAAVDWENNRIGNRSRPTRREMERGPQPRNGGEGISRNDVTTQTNHPVEGSAGTKAAKTKAKGPAPKKTAYMDARESLEQTKAQLERMKLLKEQNRLLDIDKTRKLLYGLGKEIQQNMLNIPARMTGQLEKKQIILLENEIRDVLRSTSEMKINLESCLAKK